MAGITPVVNGDTFGTAGSGGTSVIAHMGSLFSAALPILLEIAGALLLIYILWGGICYIMSGSDPKKAGAARTMIINAVVGAVIIMSTYTIFKLAESIGNAVTSSSTTTFNTTITPTTPSSNFDNTTPTTPSSTFDNTTPTTPSSTFDNSVYMTPGG